MSFDLDHKVVKPRKLTQKEIAARMRAGLQLFDSYLCSPTVLDALVKLEEMKKSANAQTRVVAELKSELLFGWGGPYHPARLVNTALGGFKDTMSYSAMEACYRDIERSYPPEVVEEMIEGGVLDDFYAGVCLDCDNRDKCHTRPWRN